MSDSLLLKKEYYITGIPWKNSGRFFQGRCLTRSRHGYSEEKVNDFMFS